MDISNGPGVRVSVFMQGCDFHCFNCFNPETHDFNGGLEFNDTVIDRILDLVDYDYMAGLSILGGDPLHPKNIKGTLELAKRFKSRFPNKTLWVWTGFLFEKVKDEEVMKYIDVLVDGNYVDSLNDPTLKYAGSTNQRVIDIPKSLKSKKVVIRNEE